MTTDKDKDEKESEKRVKAMSDDLRRLAEKGVFVSTPPEEKGVTFEQRIQEAIQLGFIEVGKDGRLRSTPKGDIHYAESNKRLEELLKEDNSDD